MSGRHSRTKGKRGELEFVHLAREQGFDKAERTAPMQCADGNERHADLAGVGRLWAECKRHRRVNVQREVRELLSKERPGFVRVLFHRDDNGPALATLEASELLKLERDALFVNEAISLAAHADPEPRLNGEEEDAA